MPDVRFATASGVIPFEVEESVEGSGVYHLSRKNENHIGEVGGYTPRVSAEMVRAADNTGAYTAGDAIAQSTTGSAVTPIEFIVARKPGGSGFLSGARCVVTAGSGTIVIANCAFDLLLFRPDTDIPFAAGSYAGDNAELDVSADAMKQIVAIFSFTANGWRNRIGANSAAGGAVYQSTSLPTRSVAPFNLSDLDDAQRLLGLIQAQGAWNPGNVAQTFDFLLDVSGG
jgi:hypothetical protein